MSIPYFGLMRRLVMLFTFMILCCSVFAKEAEPKTFLVLFKSKEIKRLKLTIKEIESQFSISFKTKTYSGNSELALVIDVPACDFDECYLGQLLVKTSSGIPYKLQDIAFRLFDMTENQKIRDNFFLSYEQDLLKRKLSKSEKTIPTP